jgi:hypothetical protein
MLKGEQAEPYLTPSRERKLVCQLCAPRAQQEGWIRESAAPETPARPQRADDRRGLRRLLRRRDAVGHVPVEPVLPGPPEQPAGGSRSQPAGDATGERAGDGTPLRPAFWRKRAPGPRSPRHVRAVPTNAQLKIDRALDLFNRSEHPRTVAGIARALGPPRVCASTSASAPAEVLVTVAWELSWYQFTVDLSDAREPVSHRAQGQELNELPEEARQWNVKADTEGILSAEKPAAETEPEAVSQEIDGASGDEDLS